MTCRLHHCHPWYPVVSSSTSSTWCPARLDRLAGPQEEVAVAQRKGPKSVWGETTSSATCWASLTMRKSGRFSSCWCFGHRTCRRPELLGRKRPIDVEHRWNCWPTATRFCGSDLRWVWKTRCPRRPIRGRGSTWTRTRCPFRGCSCCPLWSSLPLWQPLAALRFVVAAVVVVGTISTSPPSQLSWGSCPTRRRLLHSSVGLCPACFAVPPPPGGEHKWSRRTHENSIGPERWRPFPAYKWRRGILGLWCRSCAAWCMQRAEGGGCWGVGRTASRAEGSGPFSQSLQRLPPLRTERWTGLKRSARRRNSAGNRWGRIESRAGDSRPHSRAANRCSTPTAKSRFLWRPSHLPRDIALSTVPTRNNRNYYY